MGSFNGGGFSPSNVVTADLEVDSGTISVDTTNDRVGIGTTSPKTELTIEGTITVKEQANAASDTAAYGQLWVKSNAPCDLYFTDDSGQDIRITNDGSLAAAPGASVAADDINAGDSNISITGGSGHSLTLNATAATAQLKTTTSGEVDITSAANIDINATTGIAADGTTVSIDGTDDSNFTVTGSGKDLDLVVAGGSTQELRLTSAGTGAAAINIDTSAGGIDIDSADMIDIDAADEITIDTTSADGHIAITSAHTAGQSILISANADAGAILDIDAGIIDIDVQDTINIDAADEIEIATTSADGHITLTSAHVAGVAFHLDANAHADSEVQIDAGILDIDVTGAASLDSSAGSITIGAALADGQTLKLGKNGAVETIIAPHGTAGSELYSVINTAGTTDGSDAAGSILLSAVAGGIGLAWADDKDLWAEGGQAVITANHDASEAIKLHADAGSSQTIQIINDEGTTDGSYGAGAVDIEATAGGISLLWADGKDLWAEGGRAVITANEDAADCIKLHADAGGSQTITIVNDAGTGASAVGITSTAGGVTISGDTDHGVIVGNVSGGPVTIGHTTSETTVSDNLTVTGTSLFSGNATFGADDTGVDVRFFSATASEGLLYDASEDELGLLLTTKLKFHDIGGGEEIFASADGHLEVNAGTTLDMTAPTVDINASTAVTVDTPGVTITDSTASSATEGGFIRLVSDDGAAMADDHRLGVIEFAGAEDANSTITVGAKIEAICDAGWSATENGAALVMSTTDANASQSEVLRLDSNKLATFSGAIQANSTVTVGVDDTGYDVKFFGASASHFLLWDESADELVLAADSKLSFHDAAGGENIVASSDGHLEVNAGATLDMTAPTIDINASTAVTVDSDLVTFGSANANDPLVVIKNTTNDTASSRLRFVKDRGAAGEDDDNIGVIEFYGDDANEDNIEFASIGAQVATAANGQEGGKLSLRVASHNGTMTSGLTIQDGDTSGELDVTIAAGAASLTTVAGQIKVTDDIFQGDARRVIYEEVDVRHANAGDNTVSIQFGNKIPQDSVVTRCVAIVKTASNLGTHNVQIRFDVGDGRAADYDASSTSSEALGGGASTTRSSTNVGSAVDIDLTAAKETYINDTPAFMTTADVYPYVCNAGTSNGGTDSSAGTLLIYIEYYGID